jgi:hypothetical protein
VNQTSEDSVQWLIHAIRALPSDDPVPLGTPGYNEYSTQKAHWLGWLDPAAGRGSYSRRTGDERGARNVYNRVVEPKMLAWLISAAGVDRTLADAVEMEAKRKVPMATRAAAIRKKVPWTTVAVALAQK